MSLTLITEFIAAVNTTFLKGKKAAELNALWQTISSVPKCPALVKDGKRKGEVCGKSCVKGQTFCLCHMPREVVEHDTCSFILTAGKRIGQMCAKSCPVGQLCTAHRRNAVVASVTEVEVAVAEVEVAVAVAVAEVEVAVAEVEVAVPVAQVEVVEPEVNGVHTCVAILKYGKNKGKACGKKCVSTSDSWCSTHLAMEVNASSLRF